MAGDNINNFHLPEQLDELRNIPQWVGYALEWDESRGKYRKTPKNPHTGGNAQSSNPETWSRYEDAIKAVDRYHFDGVGFEFAQGRGGIDLDNVVDENGTLKPFASDIVALMDSYTEYSPSGTGLHILFKTTDSEIGTRKRDDKLGLEMYVSGRFFTITGKVYGEPKPINERTEQAREVYKRYFEKPKVAKKPIHQPVDFSLTTGEIWQKMFESRNGDQIKALYSGDLSSYGGDWSRGDQALVNHLAFWTQKNPQLIDEMFRESGLMREKWCERRGASTYGERTINKALEDVPEVYEPHERNKAVCDNGRARPMKQEATSLSMLSMSTAEEKTADWLIPEYVPRYQITLLAGDGGSGKTTVWCSVAAAVSSGRKTFFESSLPDEWSERKPEKVLFFSAEDSIEHTLRRRLRKNGANLENIFSIDIADDRFQHVKFTDSYLGQLLDAYRPGLCIFDPIQAFIPPDVRMCDRNAMRSCLAPLIGYGERFGTTFLIIVHANKLAGVWGRKRIADSADIWDISRSVIMAGETQEKGIRYLSHEKSNYDLTGETVLYAIEDEIIQFKGNTDKKDKDFVTERNFETRQKPAMDEAKEFILNFLQDGEKVVSELDQAAGAIGISGGTLKRAKAELKKADRIKYRKETSGYCKGVEWYVSLI
ncbi:MAG: AAA family ATPase [Clostridiales bacterium]|nr:AAA family ATPase [Clostridiales bacterium]